MNKQHQNVTAFVEQYTASMSKEQARSFWRKFRKAANAYAQNQERQLEAKEERNQQKELRRLITECFK
jgi:hypothetical protein